MNGSKTPVRTAGKLSTRTHPATPAAGRGRVRGGSGEADRTRGSWLGALGKRARTDRSSSSTRVPRAMNWSPGAGHAARIARVAVLAALLCGPAALAANAFSTQEAPAQVIDSAPAGMSPGQAATVGNFAAEFVTAWLTTPAGQEGSLSFYVPDSAALRLPQTPSTVQNVAVADVERAGTYRPREHSTTPGEGSTGEDGTTVADAGAPATTAASGATSTGDEQRSVQAPMVAWQVTVAADVAEPGAEGATVMVRRYFAVPVLEQPTQAASSTGRGATSAAKTQDEAADLATAAGQNGTRLRALTLPQPTTGPSSGEGADLDYSQQISLTSALGASTGEFLNAYLAGQGDISRYLSPGVQVQAVTPKAYAAVNVTQVYARQGDADSSGGPSTGQTAALDTTQDDPEDGARAQVLVTATLTGLNQQQTGAQFALALTARAGRWEVSGVQTVPALDLVKVPDAKLAAQATAAAAQTHDSSTGLATGSGSASSAASQATTPSGTATADPSTSTAARQ